MLRLDNICLSFPDNSQIRCDLEVACGEILAITGPSGVGKTTLLLSIAGFHAPLSGELLWHDDSFTTKPVWDRPLSLLFQSDNLFGHLSARRNIALSAPKQLKKHEIDAKIETITSKLGIFDILDKAASALSGGQQQRVGLARALLTDKPILLLDEPFSALDDENRHQAITLVKQLTKEHHLTTLIVTHDKSDITALKARSVTLNREPL